MGALTLGFNKLFAGKRMRSLQNRLLDVSRQIQRAQKDYAREQKIMQSEKREALNQIRGMGQYQQMGMANAAQASLAGLQSSIFGSFLQGKDINNLSNEDRQTYSNLTTQYQMEASMFNTQNSSMMQMLQSNMAQQQSQIEQYYEMQEEMVLQPLKDLEEDLMHEKETIESQLQTATQDYESSKEGEKSSMKNLVPSYTGQ